METLGFETIEAGQEDKYIAKKQAEIKAQKEAKALAVKHSEEADVQSQDTSDFSILWYLIKGLFWIAVFLIGGILVLTNLWFFVGVALFVALVLLIRILVKQS